MSVLFEMLLRREFHALIVYELQISISLGPDQIVDLCICDVSYLVVLACLHFKVVGYLHVVYEWTCA